MHIVEAADSSDAKVQEWEGITGRVKQLLEMLDWHMKRSMDSKFAGAEIGSQMDSKFADMGNMLHEAHSKVEVADI